jgi:hypothetical protein
MLLQSTNFKSSTAASIAAAVVKKLRVKFIGGASKAYLPPRSTVVATLRISLVYWASFDITRPPQTNMANTTFTFSSMLREEGKGIENRVLIGTM